MPFHRQLPEVQDFEIVGDQLVGSLTDQYAAWPGILLQPRRQVRGVPHRGIVHPEVVPDPPDHHNPRVDPDPHLQVRALLSLEILAEVPQRPLDSQRRVDGPTWTVLVGDRSPEEGDLG